MALSQQHSNSSSDSFDLLPDPIILLIFNSLSDVKSLIRCRAVSKRFNSLVPLADSLSLTVDCVISSDSGENSFILAFFKSVVKSFFDLISPVLLQSESHSSPAQILRQFRQIHRLQIEFPTAGLKVESVAGVKWRAEFGNALRNCVILIFRAIRDSDPDLDFDFVGGMKSKVFWTISALITASARHQVLTEVVEEHLEMESLILRDRAGEGLVVMDKEGLEELRKARAGGERRRTRTRVPGTTVRMRHQPRVELRDGVWLEDATLVVVRPTGDASEDSAADVGNDDDDVALRAFTGEEEEGGLYREAVAALLKNGRRYQLEMNSF